MEPVIAIIPARAGSKGLPGKNRKLVSGIPLWRWSYLAAREAPEITSIVLTTDDLVIADDFATLCTNSIAWRLWTVVVRPPELAADDTPLDVALLHAVEELGMDRGILVTLQPTVPVRRRGLISECIQCFRSFPDAKSLVTVNRLHFVWDGDSGELLNPPRVNRQAMTRPVFHEDGSVFVCRIEDFLASRTRVMAPVALYEAPRTVDIDTQEDLELAEFLLSRQFGAVPA